MLIIKLPFSSFWTVRHSFLQVVGIEIFICSTIVFLCMSCAALQSISRDMIFNNLKWSLMIFILSVMSSSYWARRNQAVKKLVKYIRKLHRFLVFNNSTKFSSSKMTLALFGVYYTPWWLCHPVVIFWPTPWCFKLMTSSVDRPGPKTNIL